MKNIALLRGINVGGTGKLPMADLRAILADLGAGGVETYIQSGNAVFDGKIDADALTDAIEARFGFRPRVLMMTAGYLADTAAANPFDFDEAKEMHVFFCAAQPGIDPDSLATDANGVERWHFGDRAVYLHSPGGLSKSKLADKLERRLGVATTARNWNTVQKLLTMSKG